LIHLLSAAIREIGSYPPRLRGALGRELERLQLVGAQ
jgi:hypothetical protein